MLKPLEEAGLYASCSSKRKFKFYRVLNEASDFAPLLHSDRDGKTSKGFLVKVALRANRIGIAPTKAKSHRILIMTLQYNVKKCNISQKRFNKLYLQEVSKINSLGQ